MQLVASLVGYKYVQQHKTNILSPSSSPKPSLNTPKLLLLPLNRLPKPCLKGDPLAIKISKSEYQAGWADCKNILHGRFFLSKGDVPIKIWGPVGQVLDPVEAH